MHKLAAHLQFVIGLPSVQRLCEAAGQLLHCGCQGCIVGSARVKLKVGGQAAAFLKTYTAAAAPPGIGRCKYIMYMKALACAFQPTGCTHSADALLAVRFADCVFPRPTGNTPTACLGTWYVSQLVVTAVLTA